MSQQPMMGTSEHVFFRGKIMGHRLENCLQASRFKAHDVEGGATQSEHFGLNVKICQVMVNYVNAVNDMFCGFLVHGSSNCCNCDPQSVQQTEQTYNMFG